MRKILLKDSIALAVETLSWMDLEGLSERQAFVKATKQLQIREESSLRLAFSLVIETTRRLNFIDSIAAWATSPLNLDRFDLGLKNFLRIYIYWTLFHKASFKETVNFLNCGRRVLGREETFQLEKTFGKIINFDINQALITKPEEVGVSLRTFHYVWFVDYCFKLLGKNEGLKLLEKNLEPPPTYLKINTLKTNSDNITRDLEAEGLLLEKVNGIEDFWRVKKSLSPLVRMNSYRKGIFQIQDLTSQVTCIAANPKPGDNVLDICSAPGVKTCSLAQMMNDDGRLISLDISKTRMQIWKREVNRLGITSAHPIICDARNNLPIEFAADVVLLDPPCSNTGIFAKSPSSKWRIQPDDINDLSMIQLNMLTVVSNYVIKFGTLTYSTCSILIEENELVIERFLKTHPHFEITPLGLDMGSKGLRGLREAIRFYPHRDQCNGFFLARMKRLN